VWRASSVEFYSHECDQIERTMELRRACDHQAKLGILHLQSDTGPVHCATVASRKLWQDHPFGYFVLPRSKPSSVVALSS
jgi:hypothetical protein